MTGHSLLIRYSFRFENGKTELFDIPSMSQLFSLEITAKMQSLAYLFSSQAGSGDFKE